jgi:hypothetical protein
VHAEVRTTPEVVGVVAIAAGREVVVPEVRTGMFVGNTRLPWLPPFFHGAYAVTFRAHDARGHLTQAAANVTLR